MIPAFTWLRRLRVEATPHSILNCMTAIVLHIILLTIHRMEHLNSGMQSNCIIDSY